MPHYPFGLCDMHCDTLYELPKSGADLYNDKHHISFDRVGDFARYTQVMAFWSNVHRTDDACYADFWENYRYAETCLQKHPEIALCKTGEELLTARKEGKASVVLAVEGGNLLGEDLSRLHAIWDAGVRIMTLVWGKKSRMGGAHDVGGGLSHFGISVLKEMFSIGMIPDVSHASRDIFYQVAAYADMAGKPFIATHSNAYAKRAHTRCLDDEQFTMIRDAGGIVGISLCIPHLCDGETCGIQTVVDHIEHYLSLGGEKAVCLGCDLDGIGAMPLGMEGVQSMGMLVKEMLARGYKESLVADIFENNAMAFLEKNLPRACLGKS